MTNLDFIPIWGFFFGTMGLILLSVEAGFALGRQTARRSPDEKESPAATMGGAVLGLVAFMLAFTFSIAAGRFDTRKELVRDEANAIRTAYMRAEFLPEAEREEVRRLLREYVDVRVALVQSQDLTPLPAMLATTQQLQHRLWDLVVANGRRDLNSDIGALLIESVNEILDLHALRVAVGIETRIPLGIWFVLCALSMLGMMAMGYQTGIAHSRRPRITLVLAAAFALVITLISGLDRPDAPFVRVPHQPLIALQAWMKPAATAPPQR